MKQFVSDVDEILRHNKGPVSQENQRNLIKYGKNGIFITGAPLTHVPKELFMLQAATVLAEQGSVKWQKEKDNVVLMAGAIEIIKSKLGIATEDGLCEFDGQGSVIVEGPRISSLTFLFGAPPHYPFSTTADREMVKSKIHNIIQEESLPISIYSGEDETYTYLDLITTTKRETAQRLIREGILTRPFYYVGDKRNDLAVMELDGVVPVAFPNCIGEVISIARAKGIYIPFLPYEEGLTKFFDFIHNGKL